MNNGIPVSNETVEKLEELRADGEDIDELIQRLIDHYRPIDAGAWEGTTKPDRAREAVVRTRDEFDV
jgi:hypothetical protein